MADVIDGGHPLIRYGWHGQVAARFANHAAAGARPGRVVAEHRGSYVIVTEFGERWSTHAEVVVLGQDADALKIPPTILDVLAARNEIRAHRKLAGIVFAVTVHAHVAGTAFNEDEVEVDALRSNLTLDEWLEIVVL